VDKLAAMRAFVDIVDRGSLTAAGEATGRSLPTMVRTLAGLEAALGVRLLRRTTRRMSLTPEGRDYLERCRRILADVAEAEEALGAGAAVPRGEIRMTAPVLFGQLHVAPAVAAFLSQHAKVSVDLLLLDRVVDLVEEGVDVALRIAALPDSAQVAIPVARLRRVVVASPELLERFGAPARPESLAERPCVGFRGLSPGEVWRFRDGARELAVHTSGPLRTNHAGPAVEACCDGLGFGRFLEYQVASAVAEGRLCVVLGGFEPPPVPVSLIYPDARGVSRRVRLFLDWMRDQLRARPGIGVPA